MGYKDSEWYKNLQYKLDNYMSKGLVIQLLMLLITILSIVVVTGVISALFDSEMTFSMGIWKSLMHIIDQGTLTGDEIDDGQFIAVMTVVTACGMVLTGTLIAIITGAVSGKLNTLRHGRSQVMEHNHVVVLGFNESVFCIIEELIYANDNKPGAIVIVDDKDRVEMEQKIAARIAKRDKTRIICRTGNAVQPVALEMASVKKASAVIVNKKDDFDVVRQILALSTYLSGEERKPRVTALVQHRENEDSARIAGKDLDIKVLYFEEAIAKIIGQVCRQPGLSKVLVELFSYKDAEFYLRETANWPKIDAAFKDKTQKRDVHFGELVGNFTQATVVGFYRTGETAANGLDKGFHINPPADAHILPGDYILFLSENEKFGALDGELEPLAESAQKSPTFKRTVPPTQDVHMLVLESSRNLSYIIKNIKGYIAKDFKVKIISEKPFDADPTEAENKKRKLVERSSLPSEDIEFEVNKDLFKRKVMDEIITRDITNILILCNDDLEDAKADSKTATLLLHLRDFRAKLDEADPRKKINITTEMNLVEDQMLLQKEDVCDFVVGSEIVNRVMVQVANEPVMLEFFQEILQKDGSDLYIRKVTEYISEDELAAEPEKKYSFSELQKRVYNSAVDDHAKQWDILIGWKLADNRNDKKYELNPAKKEGRTLCATDELILIAKGNDPKTLEQEKKMP